MGGILLAFWGDSGNSSGILRKWQIIEESETQEKVTREKQKRRETQGFLPLMLELIARFELATSSLPKWPKSSQRVSAHTS